MKPLERLAHRRYSPKRNHYWCDGDRSRTVVIVCTTPASEGARGGCRSTFGDAAAAAEHKVAGIQPFRINVPQADLVDLQRRLRATRWPEKETVANPSQGPQLAQLQELVRYWGNGYDWRKAEAKLNALPQFTTNIDGVDIHFIHVRSRHEHALPVIITHGWPGSVFEQIKLIAPADRSDVVRRPRGGRVRRGHSVTARLRLLGATDGGGLGV